jgi:hypothetical protein
MVNKKGPRSISVSKLTNAQHEIHIKSLMADCAEYRRKSNLADRRVAFLLDVLRAVNEYSKPDIERLGVHGSRFMREQVSDIVNGRFNYDTGKFVVMPAQALGGGSNKNIVVLP